jgi:uncharacterized membrane protein
MYTDFPKKISRRNRRENIDFLTGTQFEWYFDLVDIMKERADGYERPHQNLTQAQRMRRLYGDTKVVKLLQLYSILVDMCSE